MKLNQKLLKKFRKGKLGLIYDGNSLDLLIEICDEPLFKGTEKYYWVGHDELMEATNNKPSVNIYFLEISEFLIKDPETADAEEWQPVNGELVSVSDNGREWYELFFIGINMLSDAKYVTCFDGGIIHYWKHIRQIKTITRKEAEEKLGLKIID